MTCLHQLRLVLWKNFIIRKRHWFATILEVVLPVLLFLLLSYGRSKITGLSKSEVTEPTYNLPTQLVDNGEIVHNNFDIATTQVLYTPKTDFTEALMRKVLIKLTLYPNFVRGFDTEDDLIQTYFKYQNVSGVGIIFKEISSTESIPNRLKYEIRISDRNGFFQPKQIFFPTTFYQQGLGSMAYLSNEFITLQAALDVAYIELVKNSTLSGSFLIQEFPYPPYKDDSSLTQIFMPFLPHITIFSFIFLCPALIMRIIEEKSSGTRELLKMVGLKPRILWFGWFIHSFIVNAVSAIIIVILMKVPVWGTATPPIEYCQASIFLVFLILYVASSIAFCFAITSLFSRPIFGMIFGLISWLVTYIVPSAIISNTTMLSKSIKLLFAMFPNMCLTYGYSAMGIYEAREIGLSWTNLFEPGGEGKDEVSMGNAFVMFIINTAFYVLITVYITEIYPGPYGIKKSWYFPIKYFKKWNKIGSRKHSQQLSLTNQRCSISKESFEGYIPGIKIRNLRKRFGNTVAVNHLSMDIFKNQITVLLGHNGAGKTTTMSMITGMLESTEGNVEINGKDIRTQEDEVRKSLGLCLQHNLLFPDLTVMEHLELIGGLKTSSTNIRVEAENLLNLLNLKNKQNELTSTLSGGMKRKLCLAMAVIGGSNVLILDEPTAGMDPESQREIWNLLLKWRGTKTILISTHYMDEADTLGDWIAIMAHGDKQCFGSPLDLKNTYKTGYHLSIVLNSMDSLRKVQNTVKDFISDAISNEPNGNSIVFVLPIEKKSNFSGLLKKLEDCKEELNIKSISLNITTLEDVFLRTGNEHSNSEIVEITPKNTNTAKSTHRTNEMTKMVSILMKRCYFLQMKIYTYLIPVLLVLLDILLIIYLGQKSEMKNGMDSSVLKLDLQTYGKTGAFFASEVDQNVDQKTLDDTSRLKDLYRDIIRFEKSEPLDVSSASNAIIEKGKENLAYYKMHMIIAAEFNISGREKIFNAMYSPYAIHGAPISLNVLTNAIAKLELGPEYSISVSRGSLNKKSNLSAEEESEVEIAVLWLMLFPLGLLFLLGSYIVFPHMELSTGFIQLQLMCGISAVHYWLYNFLFDYCIYFLSVGLITIITFLISFICGWSDFSGALAPLLVIMACYGVSAIPFAYLFARFKSVAGGHAGFLIVSLLLGVILTIVVAVLQLSGSAYYINIGNKLYTTFMCLIPQFGLTILSVNYSRKVVRNYNWYAMSLSKRKAFCQFDETRNPCCAGDTIACSRYKDYFSNDELGLMPEVLLMMVPFCLYFTINVLLNSQYVRDVWASLLSKTRSESNSRTPQEDPLTTKSSVSLEVKKLCKNYGNKEVVKNLGFTIDRGACYGLLGVNGAGKTTTFKMLTKEIAKNGGSANIVDDDGILEDNSSQYLQHIGYDPQNDCLNFALTGRQLLRVFAYLRGFDYSELDEKVDEYINIMGLEDIKDRPCISYSGGNKRKLCLAIALIGCPQNIFLDEPTNGVDPISRRHFWNVIKDMQKRGLTFLLTSHSMQECEALCDKLGIMKDGELKCEDTIPELKKQFQVGYTVKLKLKPTKNSQDIECYEIEHESRTKSLLPKKGALVCDDVVDSISESSLRNDDVEEIKRKLTDNKFQGILKDEHSGSLLYHIKGNNLMSELFKTVEELKNNYDVVEDYVITETTIEDVFLSVAESKR